MGNVVLVTGYPGFIGPQLVRRLAADGQDRLRLLVQPRHAARARAELDALGAGGAEVLEGDVAQMHLVITA